MSMPKHTPGPWVEIERTQSYINIVGGLRSAKGLPTAQAGDTVCVRTCRVYHHQDGEANAALIKAAPMLYEALCDMVSDHECLSEGTLKFARETLALARGEQNGD